MKLYRGIQKLLISGIIIVLLPAWAAPNTERNNPFGDKNRKINYTLVLDGSCVHNVGNLQMNVTNWGFVGSLPKSTYPMADLPSAQWPGGSGIEYLYAAGIWVGAQINGIPLVSTGYPQTEFYPGKGSKDVIYYSHEGAEGGERYPSELADDDGDGMVDEDWLNGYDDDLDGKIDEDFAAYGSQMFFCQYSDDQDLSKVMWPEHEPMHIRVSQQTFQWSEKSRRDFIAVRYYVTNTGNKVLENVYVGIYADLDAGPRRLGNYHMDDLLGRWSGERCGMREGWEWPVRFDVIYVYDANGDDGVTNGYFGILPLSEFGTPGSIMVRSFRGIQSYISGWGEPTNDYERYEAMSTIKEGPLADVPNDYKVLISKGPFSVLFPWQTLHFDIAFVAGEGLEDFLDNAAQVMVAFEGDWYDLDGDPETGVKGREYPIVGPIKMIDPDPCDEIEEYYELAPKETLWINRDCYIERWRYNDTKCRKNPSAPLEYYQTGIDGKEHNLPWTVDAAPTPPDMRVIAGDRKVIIIWNNLSENVPDLLSGIIDFEGYQVWRADGWTRPYGTTKNSGPTLDLWSLLGERDIINGIPPDEDFQLPPWEGGWLYQPCSHLDNRESLLGMFEETLKYFPEDSVQCPPGLSRSECDTLEMVARYNLGMDGGMRFYKYVDHSPKNGMHYFYSVVAYDHALDDGKPVKKGRLNSPSVNFEYASPRPNSQKHTTFDAGKIYVVPNPVTTENMEPWTLNPTNKNPSGLKVEFRNLPACLNTIRIYTVAGDLVQTLKHDGRGSIGSCPWDLVSRNGQDVTSGVYIYHIEPQDNRFEETIGKFVVIR
jgi:hypothetical protein